jgi:prevent-host-death family protein
MTTVSIEEMQRDLTGYLERVQAGETLVVVQADKPVAEVKPVAEPGNGMVKPLRPFGLCAGEFFVPDDFDNPLPEDVLSQFEGR